MSDSEDGSPPLIQACPGCGGFLGVFEQEPFAQVHCPSCGTLLRVRTQVKNFTLQNIVGVGGMGTVFKALDLNLQRTVALKILRKEYTTSDADIGKLEREARITAMVNHPNVVKIYSFGEDHGQFYLSMELVEKGSLDDLLELQGQVAELQVLEIGTQIASGLQAAHQLGLIHRDVKPGNILFSDAHMTKIVDFGLAIVMEEEAAQRGEIWGTPYYVAPEKLDERPEDFRSDIYSLGGTLFHALAGRPPYEAQTASLVALKHLKSQPVSLQSFAPNAASETAYVINKMLHKDPEERYQSYEELLEHLNYAREKVEESISHRGRVKERVVVDSVEGRTWMGWLVTGLLTLLLAGGLGLWIFKDRVFPPSAEEESVQKSSAKDRRVISQDASAEFEEGRALILNGDFASAEAVFGGLLQSRGKLPEPTKSWVRMHFALAAYLGDNIDAADTMFQEWRKELGEGEPEGVRLDLANAISEALQVGTGAQEPTASYASLLDRSNPEAFVILLCMAKNWGEKQFEEAHQCLKYFLAITPKGPYEWIAEYKPLVRIYGKDLGLYVGSIEKIDAATTAAQKLQAAESALAAAGQLEVPGSLSAYLSERAQLAIEEAKKELQADQDSERAAKLESDRAAKAKLAAVESQHRKFVVGLDLEKAVEAMKPIMTDAAFSDATSVQHQIDKLEWLRAFKDRLIADLGKTGYDGKVQGATGAVIGGTITGADAHGVKVTSPYGSSQMAWGDLLPAMILAMGESFARKPGVENAGERLWLAGVYAHEAGFRDKGKALLVEGSQMDERYRDKLDRFFDVRRATN